MGGAASSQSMPGNHSWGDTVNSNSSNNTGSTLTNSSSSPAVGQTTTSALACGFSDFSLYPDRFSLSERRQTISGSLSSSSSSSTSSSSSSTWTPRVRSTTICGETVELSGADRPPNAGGAAANWRGVAEDRRRRHHSSGAKQQSYGGGGGIGGGGSGGHFTGAKQARYGGPFSDFNLYPDRYHFLKEGHR